MIRLLQPNLRLIDAANLDAEKVIQDVKSFGANTVLLNAGGMVAWYPTKIPFQKFNEGLSFDFLGEAVEAAHRNDIKAIARIDITKTYSEYFLSHPDWFRKDRNGQPVEIGPLYETCMNGSYFQEVHFEILDEILSNYPVDGIFYNCYVYRPCLSSCDACDQVLHDISRRIGVEDKESYLIRYYWMEDFTNKIKDFIGKYHRNIGLTLDLEILGDDPGHTNESGWSRKVWVLQDPIYGLAFNRLTRPIPIWPHQAGENAKYLHKTFSSKNKFVYLTYSAIFGNRRIAQPPYQLGHDIIQAAANGTGVGIQIMGVLQQDDPRALPIIKEVYQYLSKNDHYYDRAKSISTVALVFSQKTLDEYASKNPKALFLDEYYGWYEALIESKILFDIIDDDYLTNGDLSCYKMVILPNVAAISSDVCDRIDQYVDSGGNIISTLETSLFTDKGENTGKFRLNSIGRSYNYSVSAPGAYLLINQEINKASNNNSHIIGLGAETPYGGFGPLSFSKEEILDRTKNKEALFTMTLNGNGPSTDLDLFFIPPVRNNIPEYSFWETVSDQPGLSINGYGRGTSIYLSWLPGRLLYRYNVPDIGFFLGNLLKRYLDSPIIEIDGPKSIEVTMHQTDENQLIFHVINGVGLYTPTRELVPVGPITIQLKMQAKSVFSLVENQEAQFEICDGHTKITLQRLNLFDAFLIQL